MNHILHQKADYKASVYGLKRDANFHPGINMSVSKKITRQRRVGANFV